jgi:hypothetical protein
MDQQLATFIDHARTKGMDHATIRMVLLSAGWKEKDIVQALTAQALDLPVPAPPDVGGAREAFLHLVAFAALYTAVIAGLALLFDYINVLWPDAATMQYGAVRAEWVRMAIRNEISTLVVSFPILLWLSRVIVGEIRKSPDKARSPVRRWLTYLTLFVAAITLATDVIVLVSALLEGALTIHFFLKIFAVLVVAGSCFLYYLVSLRMTPDEIQTTRWHRVAGWASTAIVLIAAVGGIFAAGTPAEERLRKFDVRRAEDIRSIRDEVMTQTMGYGWRNPNATLSIKQPLPASLDQVVSRALQARPRIEDPQTKARYEYQVVEEGVFRVCATFEKDRDEPGDVAWNHPAGRHCFTFDVFSPSR